MQLIICKDKRTEDSRNQFHFVSAMTARIIRLSVSEYFHNLHFKIGKEKDEVGKIKPMVNNPCRKSTETFTKFVSNADGDPYVDPGSFTKQLRGSTP